MISLAPAQVQSLVRTSPRIGVPFAPIPLDVKARRDVSPSAKLVFATVANQARMRKGDVSNLTNRRISDRAGLNVASVRRALDQLEALGLVRRLFGDSKRIRLGIAVSYSPAEVAQGRAASNPGVAQAAQGGCSPAPQVGCAPCATDLLRSGEERSKTILPSLGGEEDLEAAALFAELGPAAYLRAMIAKGREAAGKPAPSPAPAEPARTSQHEPTPPALPKAAPVADRPATSQPAASPATARRVEPCTAPRTIVACATNVIATPAAPRTYSPAPCVSPNQVAAAVARMTRGLAEGLKAEDVGRRRVGPKRLAAQLAEVRRKHGRSGR